MLNLIKLLMLLSYLIISFYADANNKDIDLRQLLIPDFVKAQIVSDGMNMNGMDVIIIQFYSNKPFKALEDFYKKEVGDIKVSSFDQWQIISWLDKKRLNTVQATFDPLGKTTHGFIALSNLPTVINKKVILGKGFPALKRSSFMNDIKTTDLNKKSRTIWLTNGSSLKTNINFYKNHFQHKGWHIDQVSYGTTNKTAAMMMSKNGDEFNLSVVRETEKKLTNIIAVLVEI